MTDTTIGRGVIEVAVDGRKVRAGIEESKKSLNSLGITAQNVTKQSSASIDKYVRSLGVAALTAGQTTRQAELLKLGLRGATDQQIAAADAALRMTEAHQRSEARILAVRNGLIATATAAAALATAYGTMAKANIDALGRMEDLSKTTGITVEDLAGLRLLAKQSGTDLDSLAKGLAKLSVEVGKNPEEFRALGITAKDSIGQLRQFSDIFNSLPDINQRNALAQKVFSKSWEDLAPLLSEGSARISEVIERGKRLSGITTDMARAAGEFDDRLEELKTTSSALGAEMIPTLTRITKELLAAKEGGAGLFEQINRFLSLSGKQADNPEKALAEIEQKIVSLRKTANEFAQMGWFKRMFSADDIAIINLQLSRLETARAQLQRLSGSIAAQNARELARVAPALPSAADASARVAAFLNQDQEAVLRQVFRTQQEMQAKRIEFINAEAKARLSAISDTIVGQKALEQIELSTIAERIKAAQRAYAIETGLATASKDAEKKGAEERLQAGRKLYDNLIAASMRYFEIQRDGQLKIMSLDKQIADQRRSFAEIWRSINESGFTQDQKIGSAQTRANEAFDALRAASGNPQEFQQRLSEVKSAIQELRSLGQDALARQFLADTESLVESTLLKQKLAAQSIAAAAKSANDAVNVQTGEIEKRLLELQEKMLLDVKFSPNNESLKNLVTSIQGALNDGKFEIKVDAQPFGNASNSAEVRNAIRDALPWPTSAGEVLVHDIRVNGNTAGRVMAPRQILQSLVDGINEASVGL